MATHESTVADLQSRIREALGDLRPIPPDSAAYHAAAAAVLEATAELIEYEERLPLLVDQGPHRLSVRIVRWCGAATVAVALLLTLAVAPNWVRLPWLALLLPLLLIGGRLPFLPIHPPGGRHERQRVAAVAIAAALPFVVIATLTKITPWIAVVAVVLVVAGVLQMVRDVPSRRADLSEAADPAEAETPPTGLPPARMSDTWEPENELGVVLDNLRAELDELSAVVRSTPDRLIEVDERLELVRRTVQRLERAVDGNDAALRELGALVKRLDARVEWLERNIRMHDPSAVVVELDEVPPDIVHHAEVAEVGHAARARLLPAAARSGLEAAVEAHSEAVRSQAHHLDVALAASRTLADTPMGEDVHVEAIAEFRRSVTGLDEARTRIRACAREAVEAAEQLTQDDERRAAHADVIAVGDRAWRDLMAGLRSQVAEAVGMGALLPAWFTTVLGPIPPAEDTGPWMDAATQVLAYRVTYGVTDPVVALGDEPGEQHDTFRRQWHQRLRRQLRELQR